MDNPEKLATYVTQDEDKKNQQHNVRCTSLQQIQKHNSIKHDQDTKHKYKIKTKQKNKCSHSMNFYKNPKVRRFAMA